MSLINQGFPQPLVAPVALAVAQASARPITGAFGTGAAPDAYAANGFSPPYVADFSAASADYFRVAGADSDFATAFTSDSEGGGLATQVDSSGNLVWRAHNLLTYSEQFDNAAWSKSLLVLTANAAVAPDGATTADLLQEDGATGARAAYQDTLSVVAGVKYNLAMCVKNYGGLADRWAQLRVYGDGTGRAYANINPRDGTIGAEGGSAYDDVVVTSLGNGWYLAEIQGLVYSAVSGNEGLAVYIVSSATAAELESYAGDGDSGFYVWGAHVYRSDLGGMADVPSDQRAASGAVFAKYVPTTTAARYLARRRHHRWNGTAWVPTCLHEPVGATNLLLNSNTLSTQNVTVTAQAYTLHFTGTGTITLSGASTAGPLVGTGTGENNRVSLTFTPSAGTLTLTVSGTVSNAQLETGSLPSSYIPTNGTAQARTADTLKGKAASFPWSSTAVSMAIKGRHARGSGTAATLLARYEDADDSLELRVDSSNNAQAYAETGGASQTAAGGAVATGVNAAFSLAMRYVAGSAIQVAAGGTAGSEVTSSVPATPPLSDNDVLILEGSGAGDVNGTVDRVIGWDEDIAAAGLEETSA